MARWLFAARWTWQSKQEFAAGDKRARRGPRTDLRQSATWSRATLRGCSLTEQKHHYERSYRTEGFQLPLEAPMIVSALFVVCGAHGRFDALEVALRQQV
ncbi:unnamed protein product [Cercospora beticola]|nr:unnamed protein product [Cercospora beticola]